MTTLPETKAVYNPIGGHLCHLQHKYIMDFVTWCPWHHALGGGHAYDMRVILYGGMAYGVVMVISHLVYVYKEALDLN